METFIIDGVIYEKKYCLATHPKMPNHSGHSRGRKTHISTDGKKTICNMKVDGAIHHIGFAVRRHKNCLICFKNESLK